MLFQGMNKYPGFIVARFERLRQVAQDMNRSAIWTADHNQAEAENVEADMDLIKQSLRLA
jgi:hypothetical protein